MHKPKCSESIFTVKHNYYVPQDYKYSTSSLQSLTNCFSVVVTFSMSNPLIGWLAGSLGTLISENHNF